VTDVAAARKRVASTARRLAAQGLVMGTAGNVSERLGERVAVTATGAALETLTADEVAVVDLSGAHLEGGLAATSELQLHLGIYRRYDAGAVVHTHAPIGTALSCVLDELPVIHYQMLALGGPLRVAPYATFGSAELAATTVDALRDRNAALMSNHGAVVRAPDLRTGLEWSLLLEWACEIYWRAAAVGTPRTLDSGQQAAFHEAVAQLGYGDVRRRPGC
jgi:L-fuculose-phosphate aldolase